MRTNEFGNLSKEVKRKGTILESGHHFRTGPGRQFALIGMPKKGTVVSVCDEVTGYYYVKIGEDYGFIYKGYIKLKEEK